ncbi:GDP-mannose pyrophosphatase NudK [Paenibacillus wynnii]|uniref:GDP-mannose pyrophosphatase NudK n=1 Tax=Paenibacillus wynnii TaxID=268407 RepID=UPI00278CCC49|nr:GDP-mannose pyrophosphatase NudK [Paenibacillus wynnii]MDQ0195550.1 nudix-type nucleoside diphosphatase (YffH/AdpP family) [Paenibacillus wynnii]
MNPKVQIRKIELLSDNWYTLRKYTLDYQRSDGTWEEQQREAYDRGNGAAILLYNKLKKTVILTRQFRLPTYVNGNESGMLIEACAGLLDEDSPESCIQREAEEETGYRLSKVQSIGQAYMSPGSVTEILHLFVAEYSDDMKTGQGGGLDEEQENIEVLEIPFAEALEMVENGEIQDAKTILLLQHAKLHDLVELSSAASMQILIAGPYRSGTGDDPDKIAANLQAMNEAALQVYRLGHLPVLGEWYALPLMGTAGSKEMGDEIFNEIFHPSCVRLLAHCDAVLRIGGASQGADEMVRVAAEGRKKIYYGIKELYCVI